MPRPAKFAKQEPQQVPKDFAGALRAIEDEAALWKDVGRETRLAYEQGFKQLQAGWDMGLARKSTRYVMRAAGLYCMRKELRKLVREFKSILQNGSTGNESHAERGRLSGLKLAEAAKLLQKIEKFRGFEWGNIEDGKAHYHQKSHKKKAATDTQLKLFYAAAKRSQFYDVFQLIEFTGARPQELEKGIRVEVIEKQGKLALRCTVEGVKCDGNKRGLEIRAVNVQFPDEASIEVKKRWLELANRAKNGLVVRVESTPKQSVGQRLTNAFKTTAKSAGVDLSAYSLRHRFSAQTKQSNKGDSVSVALALGHQSTETQRHYGRAKRGGADVSPMKIVGIDLGIAEIRGSTRREGPSVHINEKVKIANVLSSIRNVPTQLRPKRL